MKVSNASEVASWATAVWFNFFGGGGPSTWQPKEVPRPALRRGLLKRSSEILEIINPTIWVYVSVPAVPTPSLKFEALNTLKIQNLL